MRKLLIAMFLSCMVCSSLSEDLAVTFFKADPTGIPDGWPKTKRVLKKGEEAKPGETFVTAEALDQIMKELAPAMEARDAIENTKVVEKKTTREDKLRNIHKDLKAALDDWDTLTAAQQKAVLKRLVQATLMLTFDDQD